MLKFVCSALILFGAAVWAPMAGAQTWSAVTQDETGVVSLDIASIRQAASGQATSWVRMVHSKRQWDATARAWYRETLLQRIDDCAAQTYALAAGILRDDKGQVVSSFTVPQDRRTFMPVAPASALSAAQARVCQILTRRAALKPALGSLEDVSWRSIGDTGDEASYLAPSRMRRLSGGVVAFLGRDDYRGAKVTADGTPYSRSFTLWMMDCDQSQFGSVAADFYDDSGALVYSYKLDPSELRYTPVSKGSLAATAQGLVCAPGAASTNDEDESAGALVSGTGWVGPKGYLITASHVVHGGGVITLLQDGKVVGKAELVADDPANDVAVLRPTFTGAPRAAIPFGDHPARLGEPVFTLGYPAPDELGASLKMTSGEVSALAGGRDDDRRYLQVSVPVQSGNSGGPVIDAQGHAIGVVILKQDSISDQEAAQNVNFAVKTAYVQGLVAELPDLGGYRPERPAAAVVDRVADIKDSVFLIVTERDGDAEQASEASSPAR